MKQLIFSDIDRHLSIIKEENFSDVWLYLQMVEGGEITKKEKLLHLEKLFYEGLNRKDIIVTDNFTKSNIFGNYKIVEQLLKCMNLDWLYSPIKSAPSRKRDLYIQCVVAPLFSAPNFGYSENFLYDRNAMNLNIVINKYSNPRKFIRDYFAIFGIDTNLTEFMEWLDFTCLLYPEVYEPLQRLYSVSRRVENPHKLITNKLELACDYATRLGLLEDALKLGEELNHKVNGAWTIERLRQVNVKWSQEKMLARFKDEGQKPLYTTNKVGEGILLDTQSAVYQEGMHMGHCLYTNYWDHIKHYEYLAIHLPSDEDSDGITIGITVLYDIDDKISSLRYDQAFYKYDRSLSPTDSKRVRNYYEKYRKELLKIIKKSEN